MKSIPKPHIPLLGTNGIVSVSHGTVHMTSSIVDSVVMPAFPSSPQAPRTSGGPALKGTYQEKVGACRVPGQRPVRKMGVQKLSNRLRQYPVPDELRECVGGGVGRDVMAMEPSLEEVREEGLCRWGEGLAL